MTVGDAGLGLQQLQRTQRPPGGAQVGFHENRVNQDPIVRNGIYRRDREVL